jgi:hypothetical protein
MKKNKLILPLFLLCIFLNISVKNILFAQKKETFFSARVSGQSDFQKADFTDITYPFTYKKHSATTVNFGIDIMIGKEIASKWNAYAGAGYFRNKFSFRRFYDHRLLNMGTDSLAIGTSTDNYIFRLFRIPLGISYQLMKGNGYSFQIGIESIVNFSFQQVYNGGKPFPGANNKYSKFRYNGNSILLVMNVAKKASQSSLFQFGPYIRILNIYERKDPFLFETGSQPYSRIFDAIGLSLKYSLNFKSHKP